MEAEPLNSRKSRRSPRSTAFFDHGEPLWWERQPEILRTHGIWLRPSWKPYIRIGRFLLQAIVVSFAILTLGGLFLRGVGFFCKYTPLKPGFCSNQLTASQEPMVNTYYPGTTPTTRPLQELAKLNDISPSIQVLGQVMELVNANLSASYNELYALSDVFQVSKTEVENLAKATRHIAGMVEEFTEQEYNYRQVSLLWENNGINVLGVGVDILRETINDTSSWSLAFTEHALHRLPYGASWSLSRSLAEEYLYFIGEQELAVKRMVIRATETDFVLGDLLGLFGRFERKLQLVVEERGRKCGQEISDKRDKLCILDQSHQLRKATIMRKSIQWCQDTIKVAEKHYKNLLTELSKTMEALDANTRSYRSLWPSKSVLSIRRLNDALATERAQIDSFAEAAGKAEDIVTGFESEFSGDDDEVALPGKLTEAIHKRQLRWW